MERWRTSTELPAALAALGRSEDDPGVRRVLDAFGGAPAAATERWVGEPGRRSRRLRFASGGEVVLHDGAVVAVILHVGPTPIAPAGIDLSAWIPGVDGDATLGDLVAAIGAPRRFAGIGTPYLVLDGGWARLEFADHRGWNDPGRLRRIVVTNARPGSTCRPEDDDCPTCRDLLVRRRGPGAGVDVDGTTAALAAAVAAGLLTEDAHRVPLADLRALDTSRLMERVESQLTCTSCRRIICFTLVRDGDPTFGYHALDDARRRPLGPTPPVEAWGDAARIAEDRLAMHHVDHEAGAWFLVEQQGVLHLDVRYVISSMAEDSALIRLDRGELAAYRDGGHAALSELAERIRDSSPHREGSPFHRRDLFRGPDGPAHRRAVTRAIADHTWAARQRRPSGPGRTEDDGRT